MFEEIAASRFGIWIIASVMVAADSSFLLGPGKFAYSISDYNVANIRAVPTPFMLRNKELVCSLVSFPLQIFFISDVKALERATVQETFRAMSRLRRLARQSAVFSIFSACGVSLLALGPCLAVSLGIQLSIVIIFPLFYGLALVGSSILWMRRRTIGLSRTTVLKISIEIILCPLLLINILKRISLAQNLELNSYRVALFSRAPNKTLAAMRESLEAYHWG